MLPFWSDGLLYHGEHRSWSPLGPFDGPDFGRRRDLLLFEDEKTKCNRPIFGRKQSSRKSCKCALTPALRMSLQLLRTKMTLFNAT
jgi:hypothetical protein